MRRLNTPADAVPQSWDEDLEKGLEQMHQKLGPIGRNLQRPQPQCDARARHQAPRDRHGHLEVRSRGHAVHDGPRTPEIPASPDCAPNETQGTQIDLVRDTLATVNAACSAPTRLFALTRNRLIVEANRAPSEHRKPVDYDAVWFGTSRHPRKAPEESSSCFARGRESLPEHTSGMPENAENASIPGKMRNAILSNTRRPPQVRKA